MVGNVRLEKLLEEGHVGYTFRGDHTTLGIVVTVKILKPKRQHLQAAYYNEYFRREAQITARFDDHPNIARVLDFGQHRSLPYIVLDWADCFSLRAYMHKRSAPVDERAVLKVLWAAAGALDNLHKAGIIHCDLTPEHLLISHGGQLKVTALGLARIADAAASGAARTSLRHVPRVILLTETRQTASSTETLALSIDQVLGGSPAYMAPESLRPDGEVDARSDIYALGVIGYQMIFGALPYQGNVVQVINGHLCGQARFDLPTHCRPEIIAVVRSMMHHDPAARPQNTREVVKAVRPLFYSTARRTAAAAEEQGPTFTSSEFSRTTLSDVTASIEQSFNDLLPSTEHLPKEPPAPRRSMGKFWNPIAPFREKKPQHL
jgi:serine/threonine-protein kinase